MIANIIDPMGKKPGKNGTLFPRTFGKDANITKKMLSAMLHVMEHR